MKKFFRSFTGKVILFLLCTLSVVSLIGSGLAAIYNLDEDVYGSTYEESMERAARSPVFSEARQIIWDHLYKNKEITEAMHYDSSRSNLIFRISENGKEIIVSDEYAKNASKQHVYHLDLSAFEDQYGNLTDWTYGTVSDEYFNRNFSADYIIKEPLVHLDYVAVTVTAFQLIYDLRFAIYPIGILSALILLVSYVALWRVAGKSPQDEELHPGVFHKIPFDILLAGFLFAAALWVMIVSSTSFLPAVILFVAGGGILYEVFLGLSMSLSVRLQDHSLFQNSLIMHCFRWAWNIVKWFGRKLRKVWDLIRYTAGNLPLITKTVIAVGVLSFAEFLVLGNYHNERAELLTVWFLEKLVLIPLILLLAVNLRKLQQSGQALASGNLNYKTDTSKLLWDFKKHGENLNSIATGMNLAVAKQTKSERMKTELITNVSHDIKTPLTSIINYADLIGKEECENEKIKEYSEVLLRQGNRLKRLIEDLVEASKASTGNLDVVMENCDASVFVSQASGEYEDKLKNAGLTLVTKMPEETLTIRADGRRMWRVFDNLMNNICKYAQENTRVYLTLEKQGNKAVFTFKNTSRDSLDISPDELMERFVRGDESRNTDGNGLGLSIARSLAELQKGSLDLAIDGDLFKAILRFPLVS